MAEKQVIEGQNFFHLSKSGSFGVVNDVRFVRCYWPRLDEPTALFAEGSSGIEVQGPPTPRNVLFPPDTVYLPVLVNDARVGEKPKWREASIPTREYYFAEDFVLGDVEKDVQVTKTVEVEKGVFVEATYTTKEVVQEPVKSLVELDRATAEQIADIVKARKV